MTYTVVALIRRKEGTTPAQFRAHYDNVHIPLLQSLVGATFPLSHTRHYVTRTMSSSITGPKPNNDGLRPHPTGTHETPTAGYLPIMFNGDPHEVNYDSITMMVWENQAAFDKFKEAFYREDVQVRMLEDEREFLDPSPRTTYAIEEPHVTLRESSEAA